MEVTTEYTRLLWEAHYGPVKDLTLGLWVVGCYLLPEKWMFFIIFIDRNYQQKIEPKPLKQHVVKFVSDCHYLETI